MRDGQGWGPGGLGAPRPLLLMPPRTSWDSCFSFLVPSPPRLGLRAGHPCTPLSPSAATDPRTIGPRRPGRKEAPLCAPLLASRSRNLPFARRRCPRAQGQLLGGASRRGGSSLSLLLPTYLGVWAPRPRLGSHRPGRTPGLNPRGGAQRRKREPQGLVSSLDTPAPPPPFSGPQGFQPWLPPGCPTLSP